MTLKAKFFTDMIDKNVQDAIQNALEVFFETKLQNAWPQAYDANKAGKPLDLEDVTIVLLPLDRIGAPSGASGASVFIAYYSDNRGADRLLASPPLVVKIGTETKLKTEENQIKNWPTLDTATSARFAIPLMLHILTADMAVLIAPFSSNFEPNADGTRHEVKVQDIWQQIKNTKEFPISDPYAEPENWQQTCQFISYALETIGHAHRAGYAKFKRTRQRYSDQYEWYLRNTVSIGESTDFKSHIPILLFGTENEVFAFSRTWPNPIVLVREIIDTGLDFDGIIGPIHGDLHPKNIVIGGQNGVNIIDFGWAQKDKHIVIDYLLLDINLRSITLPSQLSENEILAIADFLDQSQKLDELPVNVRHRAKSVQETIWKAMDRNKIIENWHEEYLIPLLLVSFGLLVHLDSARNQSALVALVLSATKRVREYLDSR